MCLRSDAIGSGRLGASKSPEPKIESQFLGTVFD
jgi:hypothetical protein